MIKKAINKITKKEQGTSNIEILEVGAAAPDFKMPATSATNAAEEMTEISLKDLAGKAAILVFYPADNSSVCSSQLALYSEAIDLIREHGARLVAISTDSLESHRNFADKLGISFPLLADADPSGAVSNRYGVLNPDDGKCERAILVLDPE